MGLGPEEMQSRLRSLTEREGRVLLLSLTGEASVHDIADVLGVRAAVVAGARQAIRRKLAVPRGATIANVLDERGILDVREVLDLGAPAPTAERRRSHVLRAAIREVDETMKRMASKAEVLLLLAEHTDDHDRAAVLVEVDAVHDLCDRLQVIRDGTVASARSRSKSDQRSE